MAGATRFDSPYGPVQLVRFPRRARETLLPWCSADLLLLQAAKDLHIDPTTRAPLQIEGNVKIAGHTIMRLTHLGMEDK